MSRRNRKRGKIDKLPLSIREAVDMMIQNPADYTYADIVDFINDNGLPIWIGLKRAVFFRRNWRNDDLKHIVQMNSFSTATTTGSGRRSTLPLPESWESTALTCKPC